MKKVIYEDDLWIIVEVDQYLIDLFKRKRIFFSVDQSERLRIGQHLKISKKAMIEPYSGCFSGDSLVSIGSFSYSWSPIDIFTSLGRYCSIAAGVRVHRGRHPIEALSTSSVTYDRSLSIVDAALKDRHVNDFHAIDLISKPHPIVENDVWIGTNVTLSLGIVIGTGAVIAAESVVTKNVPPYAIYGGNPAKFIKYRFNESTIEKMISSKWWEYNFIDLSRFDFSNPELFLERFARNYEKIEKFLPEKFIIDDL